MQKILNIISDSPIPTLKVQQVFNKVGDMVSQLLQSVDALYRESGLKYFVKPNYDSLLRLLLPYELKVFIDFADVCWLFENRSQIIRTAFQKQMQYNQNVRVTGKQKFEQQNRGISDISKQKKSVFPRQTNEVRKQYRKQLPSPTYSHLKMPEKGRKQDKKDYRLDHLQQINGLQKQIGDSEMLNWQHKSLLRKIIEKKLCQWVRQEVNRGFKVLRIDLRNKATQIGEQYGIRLGERWFKNLTKNNFQLRSLLTHGNCGNIKSASTKMNYMSNMGNMGGIQQTQDRIPVFKQENREDSGSFYGADDEDQGFSSDPRDSSQVQDVMGVIKYRPST